MPKSAKIRLVGLSVIALAAICGFWYALTYVCAIFNDPIEDMSFGWYVPVFSLYLLWYDRVQLRKAVASGCPSWWGVWASLPFLFLGVIGVRGLQIRFAQIAIIGLLVTVPWAFFGRALAKRMLFPALFLVFTIPITTYLDFFTIRLRLLASGTALAVLNGLGLEAVRQGTAIVSGGAHPFSIDVAEPCSGLRSLMALTALTAAYARLTQPTWTRRAILFAGALPLAVLGNVMRILTICLVAALASPDFATGFYHDYSGYIVFLAAIFLMVAWGEAVTRLAKGVRVKAVEPVVPIADVGTEMVEPISFVRCLAPIVLTPICLFAFYLTGHVPIAHVPEVPHVDLPRELATLHAEEVRYCQNEQCLAFHCLDELKGDASSCPKCGGALDTISVGEKRILPGDTRFKKLLYRQQSGREYLVSIVYGGTSKSSIHRPELCLPAQGFMMSNPQNFTVANRPFHAVQIQRGRAPKSVMAYTFFNQANFKTQSHAKRILRDVFDRSFANRIDRWVMVTVNASSPAGVLLDNDGDRKVLECFLAELSAVLDKAAGGASSGGAS